MYNTSWLVRISLLIRGRILETQFSLVLSGTDNWLLFGVLEPVKLTAEVKQSIERNEHKCTKKKETYKTKGKGSLFIAYSNFESYVFLSNKIYKCLPK